MTANEMTVIAIPEPGGPEVLTPEQRPVETPADGQILVKVEAAGVNRPDVIQRMGLYPPPKGASDIPGLEIAGRVVALGQGAQKFQVGDAVCALVTAGGYATYCVADEATTLSVPDNLSMVEAAALPETVFTVWHNIFERGALKAGDWLLIHGGSSGIGTTAIQMAVARGAKVIVTAGSAEKCAVCEKLGATRAINYREEDFVEVVKEVTQGKGANVILDMVGGDYIQKNIYAAAEEGIIIQIAFLQGSKAEVNFMRLMLKRLTLTGSTLRARSLSVKAAIADAIKKEIWPLVEQGRVKPVIDKTFPLAKAGEAHAHMESSQHIGKIVLTIDAG